MDKKTLPKHPDILGKALLEYLDDPGTQQIVVRCELAVPEVYPVSLFFRTEEELPAMETKALELCKGRVLDVGAGAGVFSLILQNRGFDVTAIDVSPGAVRVMKNQGVKNALLSDFFEFDGKGFDTILMMMNGFGFMGKLARVRSFLKKAHAMLNHGGRIVADSSDILYMYKEKDGSLRQDLSGDYYGETSFEMEYEDMKGQSFDWLFIDFETLRDIAEDCGFIVHKVVEDLHRHYLALLVKL